MSIIDGIQTLGNGSVAIITFDIRRRQYLKHVLTTIVTRALYHSTSVLLTRALHWAHHGTLGSAPAHSVFLILSYQPYVPRL